MRVGFIGLGKMGAPMCRRLLANGFSLTVHNRSREKVEMLVQEGANAADSAREVVDASDAVLACLPDGPTVESVFLGDDGIVESARPGQALVDHSTVSSRISKRIGEAAALKGALFIDAPISGGVERAADGSLTIMAGGDDEAFNAVLPVFRAMGGNIRHVGPIGSGSTVKLVNQHLVAVHSLAAAEALLAGVSQGADPDVLIDILSTSWGNSFMLERNGPAMLDRDFNNARAPLRLIYKDLAFALEGARQSGVATPLGERTMEIILEAEEGGMLDLDVSCLALPLEKRSGAQLRRSSS